MKFDGLVDNLANALLAGDFESSAMVARLLRILRLSPRTINSIVERILRSIPKGSRPAKYRLVRVLRDDPRLRKLFDRFGVEIITTPIRLDPPAMRPAMGNPSSWTVPPIETIGQLGALLNLTPAELNWFADIRSLESKTSREQLRHYRYHWVSKRNGTQRLIESPKARLKAIQRFIAARILSAIPPHSTAHGFRAGHSIFSFAVPHIGQRILLRLDLKDFFASITRARIRAFFLTVGYPESVALLLAGLVTNSAPAGIFRDCRGILTPGAAYRMRNLYRTPHLPQGAPSSPALANLCAFRLDARLAGLASSAGATYTRYADDLLFSGADEFARTVARFHVTACRIALEEGFEVQTRKTRVMHSSIAQRAAGLILNRKINVPRRDFDLLKAILHNCIRHGPESQNRDRVVDFDAHLRGRIAHVSAANPDRGAKLQELFDAIRF